MSRLGTPADATLMRDLYNALLPNMRGWYPHATPDPQGRWPGLRKITVEEVRAWLSTAGNQCFIEDNNRGFFLVEKGKIEHGKLAGTPARRLRFWVFQEGLTDANHTTVGLDLFGLTAARTQLAATGWFPTEAKGQVCVGSVPESQPVRAMALLDGLPFTVTKYQDDGIWWREYVWVRS